MNEQRPGELVGQYYRDLRKQGVGRHLAASLTVDYAKAMIMIMVNAVKK